MTAEVDRAAPDQRPTPLRTTAQTIALLIGGAFSAGGAAGYHSVAAAHGALGAIDFAILAVFASVSLACAAFAMNTVRARIADAENVGPRSLVVRKVWVGSTLLGFIVAMVLVVSSGQPVTPSTILYSDAPIPPLAAWFLLGATTLTLLLSWVLHRNMDEHEAAANGFGAMLAIYAYFTLSVGWWIAWRGGLLIEPDGKAIFWAVMLVWGVGWLWRKYH